LTNNPTKVVIVRYSILGSKLTKNSLSAELRPHPLKELKMLHIVKDTLAGLRKGYPPNKILPTALRTL